MANNLLWHTTKPFEMIVSDELLFELEIVLLRQKFRRYITIREALEYVMWLSDGASLLPQGSVSRLSRDPDDDYLLALAQSSGADHLVSGDPDLNSMEVQESGVNVLTPRAFYDILVVEEDRD